MEQIKHTNPLVSIIVPVYNVEKYLVRCVKSIQNQTYRNLRILLIDDGSTDKSGMLCEELKASDSRITVIHQPNGGLSAARNRGLQEADGEILAFADSDDYIHPDMIYSMLDVMNCTDADMVCCEIAYVDEKKKPDFGDEEQNIQIYEKEHIYEPLWERDAETVVQCNKLYKRHVLERITYPVGRLHEDVYVIHEELSRCSRVAYVSNHFYYYVQRQNSIMHMESQKSMKDAIEGYRSRIRFFKEQGCPKEAERTVYTLLEYIKWKYDTVLAGKKEKELLRWLQLQMLAAYEEYAKTLPETANYKCLAKHPAWYRVQRKLAKLRKG